MKSMNKIPRVKTPAGLSCMESSVKPSVITQVPLYGIYLSGETKQIYFLSFTAISG